MFSLYLLIYTGAVAVYGLLIRLASCCSLKARQWVRGRRQWAATLQRQLQARPPDAPLIWMHCASLGEFEQGRPVLEALRTEYPHAWILLTFFSPSGYEIRKSYKGADVVSYLPLDTRRNARQFLDCAAPSLALFVKYEYWYFHLRETQRRAIPVLLIAHILRPGHPVLHPLLRVFFWRVWDQFTHIFAQNTETAELLQRKLLYTRCTVGGDTRFDRVAALAEHAESLPEIETFMGARTCLVAGSTWPEDERLLIAGFETFRAAMGGTLCLILAPHQMEHDRFRTMKSQQAGRLILHSELTEADSNLPPTVDILLVDRVGLLNRIYRYGELCWVGGGFGVGIHNILEAAVYGKKVLFGPRFQKAREAHDLIQLGSAASVKSVETLQTEIRRILAGGADVEAERERARTYVLQHRGATHQILRHIRQSTWGSTLGQQR